MVNKLSRRERWIDVAKALAIMAVMLDHTYYVLYTQKNIAYASYFSVSMFVLLMGITSYSSLERYTKSRTSWVAKRCKEMVIPYLVASAVYVILYHGCFDFVIYVERIIHFNAVGPLYFVSLFLQLVIISPLIFRVFFVSDTTRKSIVVESVVFLIVIVVSIFTTKYTSILSIYGGGGKLFGGTYLILLYIGMWFAKYADRIQMKTVKAVFLTVIGAVGSVLQWLFIVKNEFRLDKSLSLGSDINPPGICLMVYALLLTTTVYAAEQAIKNLDRRILQRMVDGIAKIGNHTLYIFLFNGFFLEVLARSSVDNIWVKRVIYFPILIVGSLLCEVVLKKIFVCIQWIGKGK